MIGLLYYLYLLLPLSFALNPSTTIDLPVVRIFIVGIFFAFLTKGFLEKRLRVTLSPGVFFLWAWFIWSCLSFVWALDPSWSYRKVAFLLNFFLLALILSMQQREALEKIAKGYVVGAIGIASIGLIQSLAQVFFGPGPMLHFWTQNLLPLFLGQNFSSLVMEYPSLLVNIMGKTYLRATGFFPDPHIFSYYVAMAVPFAFFYAKKSSFYKGGTLILLTGVLLSFSRGGYVGLFTCWLWFLGMIFWTQKEKKIALWIVSTLFFLILIVVSPVGSRFWSSFATEDGSRVERVRLLSESFHFIQEKPLLGTGIGNYPFLVKPEAERRAPIYVHNLYLDIAVETGLIGLTLFLLAVLSALVISYRFWQISDSAFYLSTHLALVYFLAHSLFESPLFSVHVLPVFFLLMSLCLVYPRKALG